jgi:hypothetical protein
MSLGNQKGGRTVENRGSAFTFERGNLWHLKNIEDVLTTSLPPGGVATEATLAAILTAVTQNYEDLEIKLVRDTGDSDVVVQQIRAYDKQTDTWTTTYEKVDGSAHTVIGPLEYLDASAVLNLILTELQSIGFGTNRGNLSLVKNANDYNRAFTYADAQTTDERVTQIVHSSALLGVSVTETFTYSGTSPYYVTNILLS